MIYRLYKISNLFYRIKLIPFTFLLRLMMKIIFSCDIPYKAEIGEGTKFPHHALGILIHPRVKRRKNCKILHGITIGGKSCHKEFPIVEDNVLIGADAIVTGPIKIGKNSIIGAGSVVIKDVPENSIFAGNPAKIIKKVKR